MVGNGRAGDEEWTAPIEDHPHRVVTDIHTGVVNGHRHLIPIEIERLNAIAIDQLSVVVHRVADLVDRDRRGDLAGGVTAHAIGDQEQPELLVDEEVILVVIPLPADVGRCGKRELHRSPQVSWNLRVG